MEPTNCHSEQSRFEVLIDERSAVPVRAILSIAPTIWPLLRVLELLTGKDEYKNLDLDSYSLSPNGHVHKMRPCDWDATSAKATALLKHLPPRDQLPPADRDQAQQQLALTLPTEAFIWRDDLEKAIEDDLSEAAQIELVIFNERPGDRTLNWWAPVPTHLEDSLAKAVSRLREAQPVEAKATSDACDASDSTEAAESAPTTDQINRVQEATTPHTDQVSPEGQKKKYETVFDRQQRLFKRVNDVFNRLKGDEQKLQNAFKMVAKEEEESWGISAATIRRDYYDKKSCKKPSFISPTFPPR